MTGITKRYQAWAIAIVLLAVLSMLPQPAAAAEGESSIPLKTEISITREIKGGAIEADSDTYVLTAKEEGAPMPAGSTDGSKSIHTEGLGRASFGEIVLPRPDVYEYTVRRERNDRENMTKSYPSYEVRLIALAGGRVSQIVTAEDGEKAELLFSCTGIYICDNGVFGNSFSVFVQVLNLSGIRGCYQDVVFENVAVYRFGFAECVISCRSQGQWRFYRVEDVIRDVHNRYQRHYYDNCHPDGLSVFYHVKFLNNL